MQTQTLPQSIKVTFKNTFLVNVIYLELLQPPYIAKQVTLASRTCYQNTTLPCNRSSRELDAVLNIVPLTHALPTSTPPGQPRRAASLHRFLDIHSGRQPAPSPLNQRTVIDRSFLCTGLGRVLLEAQVGGGGGNRGVQLGDGGGGRIVLKLVVAQPLVDIAAALLVQAGLPVLLVGRHLPVAILVVLVVVLICAEQRQ